MKFRAILTHNPQDYFEDKEDAELVEEICFDDSLEGCFMSLARILDYVCGGYKAIILLKEGDDTG